MRCSVWAGFVVAALVGCGFEGRGDGTSMSLGDPPCELADSSICVHPADETTGDVTLPNGELNTDTSSLCAAEPYVDAGSKYCIVRGLAITVPAGSTVRAVGSRPLVLVAKGTLEVHGAIDVSSAHAGFLPAVRGAGANASACQAFMRVPESKSVGGGGGAGASFAGRGGGGGDGNNDGQYAGGGLTQISPLSRPQVLQGGCRGQNGGGAADHASGGPAGTGGDGGGALYLASKVAVVVTGKVLANGAGGGGGGAQAGGGGGGSGGFIVLDAPDIKRGETSVLAANGGGGGQGGRFNDPDAIAGGGGEDGTGGQAAQGGNVEAAAGRGASGSYGGARDGMTGSASPEAGGGGGGAAGFLVVYGTLDGPSVASPPLTLLSRPAR